MRIGNDVINASFHMQLHHFVRQFHIYLHYYFLVVSNARI